MMKKIMIVDDEVLVKVGIKSLLKWEDYGYTIVADASDGMEAVKKIEEYKPHIVLTDLMMEPEDGFWLMEECARRKLPVKFIVLSNYNDFENVKRAMKAGAVDYVFKLTVKKEEMLKVLEEAETELEAETVWQNNDSQHIVRKNMDAIKKNIFQKLVSPHTYTAERMLQEIGDIPLSVNLNREYCTLYLRIDNLLVSRKNGNFMDTGLLNFTLENIVGEVFEKLCPCEIFISEECDLVAALSFSGEYIQFMEELESAFNRTVKYIRKYYGLGISGAVSQAVLGADQFRGAVEQNKQCMGGRFFSHTNMLHKYRGGDQQTNLKKREEDWKEEGKTEEVCRDYHLVMYEVTKALEAIEASGDTDVQQVKLDLRRLYKKLNLSLMSLNIDIEYIVNKDGVNLEEAVNYYDFYEDVKNAFLELMEQYESEYTMTSLKPCRREIVEVKSYVNNHLAGELSVSDMAALASMSESRFSHVFKEETGVSFVEYVNEVKMDMAEKLLKTTDLKVNEIAEAIGIYNSNYFSTQFKRRRGISPNQYRKQ